MNLHSLHWTEGDELQDDKIGKLDEKHWHEKLGRVNSSDELLLVSFKLLLSIRENMEKILFHCSSNNLMLMFLELIHRVIPVFFSVFLNLVQWAPEFAFILCIFLWEKSSLSSLLRSRLLPSLRSAMSTHSNVEVHRKTSELHVHPCWHPRKTWMKREEKQAEKISEKSRAGEIYHNDKQPK